MASLVRLYFAAAVRGAGRVSATSVAALERLGVVTTRHMASPQTVDLGHASDDDVYAADQRLLAQSDLFIGDFSTPTTGGGFMAARALQLGKPVLALFEVGQRASAMLAGNPQVTVGRFSDEQSFFDEARRFVGAHLRPDQRLRAPKVVLAGPPGSGKGTLAAALAKKWGAMHVSTGELLRELVKTQPTHPLAREVSRFMQAGQLVPAETMRAVVLERLSQPDCQAFGFLLDGYPPSRADLANLAGVEPDVVFALECDDDVAVQRQVSRAARTTDTEEKARTRLEVYRREPLEPDWFPRAVTVRLDAAQPKEDVFARAHAALQAVVGEPRRTRSYFLSPARRDDDVRSTRVHFHLDAPDTAAVRALGLEVLRRHPAAQGQLKLYPIDSLRLGPQSKTLPVYAQLPNFRVITRADDEAFITGRLGDGDDALMQVVLEVTKALGGMTELEEYTGEWTLMSSGAVRLDARYTPQPGRFDALLAGAKAGLRDGFSLASGPVARTPLELHLGFDVPRAANGELPLSLEELVDRCADAGLSNGGWFVFKKDETAAYRSNEFSTLEVAAGEEKLFGQAHALREVLKQAGLRPDLSFSLELVHGIWVF